MQEIAIAEAEGLHGLIVQVFGDRDVPPSTGLTLARARRELQEHLQDYNSVRQDILEKYGVMEEGRLQTDDEGRVEFHDSEAEGAAQEEITELRAQMVEVEALPLPADLLDGVSDLPYSSLELLSLYMAE